MMTSNSLSSGFVLGTLVHTDYGFAPIEWIDVGTKVLSRCALTGQQSYRQVVRTIEPEDAEIHSVVYVLEDGRKDSILVTGNYKFWVRQRGWVQAQQLKAGHQVEVGDPVGMDDDDRPAGDRAAKTLSGKRWSADVVRVVKIAETFGLYDLEVEEYHTFCVGQYGALVSDRHT